MANASSAKLAQNQLLSDLIQALGVGTGAKYRDDDLRYERMHVEQLERRGALVLEVPLFDFGRGLAAFGDATGDGILDIGVSAYPAPGTPITVPYRTVTFRGTVGRSITVYAPRGGYQLIARTITPIGAGDLLEIKRATGATAQFCSSALSQITSRWRPAPAILASANPR